jgi:hypothetical protein
MIAVACVASGKWNEGIELIERVLARRGKDGWQVSEKFVLHFNDPWMFREIP